MDVRDVPAIKTGAASDLGRALAQALAQAGARVTLVDHNAEGERGVILSTASKAGVVGLTLPAAREFASLCIGGG